MLQFRQLKDDEYRILGVRHGEHEYNELTPEWREKLKVVGVTLGMNLYFAFAFSSLYLRGIETVACVLRGAQQTDTRIMTDSRLNPLDEMENRAKFNIRHLAAELEITTEQLLGYRKWDQKVSRFLDKTRFERGREGAALFLEFEKAVSNIGGKNILFGAHSGYRAEHIVTALRHPNILDKWFPDPDEMMAYGDVIEVILKAGGEFVGCRHIPNRELMNPPPLRQGRVLAPLFRSQKGDEGPL